ncbi:MAG: prepilin-type N-terminal cleavage/methylation domain-containing protein [Akkermansiaceae bacterium]|nr:prepilin-type N-terminal cleavage/methylation domain-containing protein [Verrucomicrobiales bacterium]
MGTFNTQHSTSNSQGSGVTDTRPLAVECSPFAGLRRCAAFTLVELMVVVALIGIMTAMILPEMRGTYEDALLRSASRELLDAFSVAHSRAVSFNQPHRVSLNRVTGEYRVEKRVRDRGRVDFAPVRDVAGGQGKLDARITVEFRVPGQDFSDQSTPPSVQRELAVGDEITFFTDGTADAKEVLLRDRQGFRLLLRVNPTTARVRVVELAGASE